MSEIATPGAPSAPTAAPASPKASSAAPTNSGSTQSLSTADFKRTILGRKTPTPAQTVQPDPEPVESSSDDNADESSSDDFAQEPVEQQVADATNEETDWSWAEPLAGFREGVHGIATAELLQALASGQIPDALMDKLSLTMKDGDEEWTGTVADLRNGAQMHANFTRKSQQFAQEKKQFEAERSELVDHFRGWKDDALSENPNAGERGLIGLERMLGNDAVYKIAQRLAARLERKDQLEAAEAAGHIPPGTAAIVLEREQLARENAEMRRFKERHEAQQQQQEVQTQGSDVGKRINKEAVTQFKLAGIEGADLTTGMWGLFKEELLSLWTDANKTPGPTEIRTAVMAAKQRAERIVRQHAAELAKKQPVQNKPAVTGAAPAGAPGAPKKPVASANKAMSTNEFKKKMMNTGRPFSGR